MRWTEWYFGGAWVARLLLQRGMAAVYCVAFLTVVLQCRPLIGERGLLPAPEFLRGVRFKDAPSLFHWKFSDRLLMLVGWSGLGLSVCALLGWTDAGPVWVSVAAWLMLYALYLSVVNVGQRFFGFGWESMLLEAGFFTAFLGPRWMQPSLVPVLALRWMLFRTEMGAGLIKLRHDPCWRDLTCLFFHYETQPLPNPLSWYFHWLPKWSHKAGVLGSHFVQVVVPFGLFAPQPVASVAAALLIGHQLWLIVSGNYSWLNWLTVVLGFAGFGDAWMMRVLPVHAGAVVAMPVWVQVVEWALAVFTLALSVRPALNLISREQMMNFSYNPWHLVGAYGAFGSVGRKRYEIVLEGTRDGVAWEEYGFCGKPGDVRRRPPQVAPYHLRLDWLIWFLPFGVMVTERGVHVRGYEQWFLRFVLRLLEGDRAVLGLMGRNPFADAPPMMVRALFYEYRFTTRAERRETGDWWVRTLLGVYLQAVGVEELRGVG